ncbi:TPA: glycine C-acetyltransferase, partial [Candidatus Komeilibacteria bacterium]|nr:glycine C-acetyltransferase [Candidatus Komeilibacteria bacterium]
MYTQQLTQNLSAAVDLLKNEQRFKSERELQGGQGPVVKLKNHEVIMLAANNYLGLANHPVIKKAAQDIVEKYGFGMSSVRFICGTQDLHRRLEKRLA